MQLIKLKEALAYFKSALIGYYPKVEIQSFTYIVFGFLLNMPGIKIHTNTDMRISESIYKKLIIIIDDLKSFKPIQYIIGEIEFYNLKLNLNQSVLIPRPETEELVDWILKSNLIYNPNILDIGTGSGCIALALAANIKKANITAIEKSAGALKIARLNAESNNLNIHFIELDILAINCINNLSFDIIVSNPPYVLNSEKENMELNVLGHEPHEALFVSNDDPLLFYKSIAEFAKHNLKSGGMIYFEINEKYGNECKELLASEGFSNVELKRDLHKKNRMLRAAK